MAKKVLSIVDTAYRATLEEQDDTAVWFTHILGQGGADITILLTGNAVNYAVRGQQPPALSFGTASIDFPPRLDQDLHKAVQSGVKLALRELAGLSGAQSVPRERAKGVILFLTDGKPSLPFGLANKEDPEDIEAVVDAARLAKAAGVMLNVFGLGPGAIDYPIASTEIARVTGGLYTPVRRPGDIVSMLTGVSFANVEDVVAVNLTLGEMAGPDDILLHPDGSFRGYVPVRPGKNRIRVSVLASDGSRGSTEVEIVFAHQDLTDAELEAELDRVRERNRQLQLVMERKRQERFRRQEAQRALTIEIEEGEDEEKSTRPTLRCAKDGAPACVLRSK